MAGESTVKLIGGWSGGGPSPFLTRMRIAFNVKGIEYEFLEETFGRKSELLLKSNPVYKKIPVLLHGDKVICESMIIIEYVDKVWGSAEGRRSILPADPYDHAVARFWSSYVDEKCFPSIFGLLKALTEEEKASHLKQLLEVVELLEGAFEKCSRGKSFFGGDDIGCVDIAFGCYLGWIKATQEMMDVVILDGEKTPLLLGWTERFYADEAVKGVMPEPESLIQFWKNLHADIDAMRMNAAAAN